MLYNKMNLFFLLIFSLFYSCQNYSEEQLTFGIKENLADLDIKSEISISNKTNDSLVINVNLLKPYRIVNSEQQDVLISYLIYKQAEKFNLYKNILFFCYLNQEEKYNRRRIHYDKSKIDKVYNFYNENPRFVSSLEFVMTNFLKEDVFSFETNSEIINKSFPKITDNDTFFNFLNKLYMESKENKVGKATNIMLLMYFSFKDNLTKSEGDYKVNAERYINYFSRIWKIYTNSDINDMEYILDNLISNGG